MAEDFRWKLAEEDDQLSLFPSDDALERRGGVSGFEGLEFLHVRAGKIINELPKGSGMPFRFTINPYRGCSHACVYCFARPTHRYLNLDIGNDFDSKIVVKINAVERARSELNSVAWQGEPVALGTNTDPYQRAEGKYRLTRGIVEALIEARNPFSILTKSTLVLRDIDLLTEAAKFIPNSVNFSIPTLDVDVWQKTEPGTPHPRRRVDAVRRMRSAGVRSGVLVAPVLPGISDGEEQLREVVDACLNAGASWVAPSMLHLKKGLRDHWMKWLHEKYPELLERYEITYAGRAYVTREQKEELVWRVSCYKGNERRTKDDKRGNDRSSRY